VEARTVIRLLPGTIQAEGVLSPDSAFPIYYYLHLKNREIVAYMGRKKEKKRKEKKRKEKKKTFEKKGCKLSISCF
jgi:hypothetical protein